MVPLWLNYSNNQKPPNECGSHIVTLFKKCSKFYWEWEILQLHCGIVKLNQI